MHAILPETLGKHAPSYAIVKKWVIFFLSGLEYLEQRAKKCIELRGEYVE